MAGFTTFLQQELLDHIGGNGGYTAPTPYVGLYTAAPTDAGGGTEVSGGSYARVDASAKFGAASGTTMSNDAAITFPTATGSWGTVTHFGVFDASTSGNLLYWGALSASKTVGSGDTASFAIGELDVTLD
jgi:hypothetical protein